MTLLPPTAASNFEFLRDDFPLLYTIGKEAEFQLYPDPAAALFKLRLYGEKLVDQLFAEHQLVPPVDNTQHHRLGELKRQEMGILNLGILKKLPVPLTSIYEQEEIVRQVNHYFGLADQLEARFEQAAALVEQLPQALLAKAFSGQLVPQDPDDEPAGALLERLQVEPAAPVKGKRGRKKISSQTQLFS